MEGQGKNIFFVALFVTLWFIAVMAVVSFGLQEKKYSTETFSYPTGLEMNDRGVYSKKTDQPTENVSSKTEDEKTKTYLEITKMFQLIGDDLIYFRIHQDDRVSFKTEKGITYLYKDSKGWVIAARVLDSQSLPCNWLVGVPIDSRPPCTETGGEALYINSAGTSINYPDNDTYNYTGS